jgi:hypothetical protein
LPAAQSLDYDPMGSEFFFTTADAFEKLKGSQIQEIFYHHHIVIPGQPQDEFQFNC